jgi:hypothetical protein
MSRKRFNAQIAQYKTPAVEGNGFADWNDGIKCYLPSATIYGECKQETGVKTVYGNKNIFDKSLFADGFCLGGYYPGTSNSTYGDGVCSIGDNLVEVKPNTTYTISVDDGYPYRVAIVEYSSGKGLVFDHSWKNTCPITFTTYPNTKYLWIVTSSPNYSTPITVDEILSYKWQIEEGSIATSYVPYSTEVREVSYPSPDLPSSVKCNNGTFKACGRNLLPSIDEVIASLTSAGSGYSQYVIQVPPNTKVTICSIHEKQDGMQFYLHINPDTTGKYGGAWMYHPSESAFQNNVVTVTAGADGLVKIIGYGWGTAKSAGILDDNLWAVIGDKALPYEPYFDGGSATAPNLYGIKIGDNEVHDELDVSSGRVSRKITSYQLTGKESINGYTSYQSDCYVGYINMPNHNISYECAICTHYKIKQRHFGVGGAHYGEAVLSSNTNVWFSFPPECTTADMAKQWLAEKYAAGNPVTMYYPTTNPTEEFVEPVKLIQPSGNGAFIQTAGDVVGCPVSAKYLTHS